MTKEITKAYILQQIQDKFKLRDMIPEKFTFKEEVVPTYGIEPHLLKWNVTYVTINITGTGGKTFYTVPATQKWHINGYNVVFMTGVYTVAGAFITRAGAGPFFYLDLTAAQSVSYTNVLAHPLILNAGDTLEVNVDGYTSSGDLRLYIDYAREEIR